MADLNEKVNQCCSKYVSRWNDTYFEQNIFDNISAKEKKQNEKDVTESLDIFFGFLNTMPESEEDKTEWETEFKELIKERAKIHLKIKNPALEKELLEGMLDSTEKFIEKSREFDAGIKGADIMQAMRNVWIMNLLQLAAGERIEFTPSVFAYSMLYPYTDNFLDNPDASETEKKAFNERLSSRLKGEETEPENEHERKVFSLIGMIEGQYDRAKYPQVYQSVLAIQNAQIKSLSQQSECKDSIAYISALKGGTSVLADAYLVCGTLENAIFDFAFGFGFMLQLLDDLQDAKSDSQNNHRTLFSECVGKKKLDEAADKLMAFIKSAAMFDETSGSNYSDDIKTLITDNCLLMAAEAVSKNKKCFSGKYLRRINSYSSLSIGFMRRANKKIKRKMKPLAEKGII